MSSFGSAHFSANTTSGPSTGSTATTDQDSVVLVDAKVYWTYKISVEDINNREQWSREWVKAALDSCQILIKTMGGDCARLPAGMAKPTMINRFLACNELLQTLGVSTNLAPASFDRLDDLARLASAVHAGKTDTEEGCGLMLQHLYGVAFVVCPEIAEFWRRRKQDLDCKLQRERVGIHLDLLEDFTSEAVSFFGTLIDAIVMESVQRSSSE